MSDKCINNTGEIPISETLENLLTDIEFEIQDSTTNTSEVTREETTNTEFDSTTNMTETSEVTREDAIEEETD